MPPCVCVRVCVVVVVVGMSVATPQDPHLSRRRLHTLERRHKAGFVSSILLRLGIDKHDTTNRESVLACLAAALEKYPLPAAPAPTPAKQSGAAAAPTRRAQSSTAAAKAATAAVPMPPPVVPGSGHANTPILVPGSPKPSRGKRQASSPRRNPSKAEAVTEAAANADAPSKPTRRKVPAKARVYTPRPPSSRRGGTSGGN